MTLRWPSGGHCRGGRPSSLLTSTNTNPSRNSSTPSAPQPPLPFAPSGSPPSSPSSSLSHPSALAWLSRPQLRSLLLGFISPTESLSVSFLLLSSIFPPSAPPFHKLTAMNSNRTYLRQRIQRQKRPLQPRSRLPSHRPRRRQLDRFHHHHLLPTDDESCHKSNIELYSGGGGDYRGFQSGRLGGVGEEMVCGSAEGDRGGGCAGGGSVGAGGVGEGGEGGGDCGEWG